MIATSNPQIDVHALMERVREEAKKICSVENAARRERPRPHPGSLPPAQVITLPALALSRPMDSNKNRADDKLRKARGMIEVSSKVPKLFRRLFRRQGGFNRAVLETLSSLAKTNEQLAKRVRELTTAAEQHNHWVRAFASAHQSEIRWLRKVQEQASELQSQTERTFERARDLQAQADRAAEHLGNLQTQADRAAEHLGNLQTQADRTTAHTQDLQAQADRTVEHLAHLQAQADRAAEHLPDLQAQADRAAAHLRNLQAQADRAAEHLPDLQAQADRAAAHLGNLQTQADRTAAHTQDLQAQADRTVEHLAHLQDQSDRQGEYQQAWGNQLERHGAHLRNLQDASRVATERLRDLQGQTDRSGVHLLNLQGDADRNAFDLRALQQALLHLEERQVNDAVYIKGELSQQSTILRRRRVRAVSQQGDGVPSAADAIEHDSHHLDAFYLSFENRFRGTRAEIKERVRFYLPFLQDAAAGTANRPILDVGCGRGEWLEVLRENGFKASGLDLSAAMVAQCRARDLPAIQADAVAHLRSLRDRSVGALSGFHIIEHLPLETLVDLFSQTRRVLCPGGVAFFESPNCKNLMVGACNFNADPTHRNPVFPETAAFMMETQGFERIQLEYLSPVDTSQLPESRELPVPLQQLLYGPQDFAVIGRKPRAP